MSGSGLGFWGWHTYAKANDDIRNRIVEEGWSGRSDFDQSFANDVRAKADSPQNTPHGNGIIPDGNAVHADREGWNAFYDEPNGDSTRDAAHEFYGTDRLGHDQEQQAQWDLRQAEAHELYGPEAEPEQER